MCEASLRVSLGRLFSGADYERQEEGGTERALPFSPEDFRIEGSESRRVTLTTFGSRRLKEARWVLFRRPR